MSERVRSSRFSVYVPTPKVRLNMGQPIYKPEDGTATFGYTGMSLQSDRHLFIDVNKVALYQSGSHSMWQVGGKWLQYSNANMVMACTASNTMAASAKVVIVAGAGHGQITALDHGQPHVTPRMVDYNNLDLHYRVEEVHNGLKQSLYGPSWKTAQKDPQKTQLKQYKTGYAGGLLEDLRVGLKDLGRPASTAKTALQPLEWEGNYVEMKNGFPPSGNASVFSALKPFDPYPAAGFRNPGPAKVFGQFLQTVNFFHRFVDVLGKVGPAITDNFVVGRVQNLINIWGHAQESLQTAMNVGDFVRWDQSGGTTGLAMQDESGNLLARPQSASFSGSEASLTSRPERYDLTGLSGDDLEIQVMDADGGAARTLTLTLSDVPAAPVSLTPTADHQQVEVSITNPAAPAFITLDGTRVHYSLSSAGYAWGDPPEGFERTGQRFKRSDGELFAADAGGNLTMASIASGTISIEVDGASGSVDLATLAAASDRAASVAAQLGSVAAAAGATVTLSSARTGLASTIKVPTGTGEADVANVARWLGLSERADNQGSQAGTAAWLAAQFSALGMNFGADAGAPEDGGSDVCTLTHNTSGSSSYLKLTGGATTRLFGADPAISKGKELDWLGGYQDARVLQYEIAKWPEDVRNLFRPVVEAFKDVMGVYDRLKGIIDEVMSLAGLSVGPPSSIGMFAGDGITLGTGGRLFGAADGITLIASPKGDPDSRKFAMGPVEKFLTKASDWDPLKEYFKNRDAGHPFQVAKKDGHKTGGIRILSAADVFMASKGALRLTSLEKATLEGPQVAVTAVTDTVIATRQGGLRLFGKHITVGREAAVAKRNQLATEWLRLVSKEKLEFKSVGAAQVMDNDVIHLGSRGGQAFAVKLDKPRVYISTKAGSETAQLGTGDASGEVAYGFAVDAAGDAVGVAKSELILSTGASGMSVKSGGVEITGQFKVGPEFVVKSSGKLTPATVMKSVMAQHPRGLLLPTEYAALMLKARTLLAAGDTVLLALDLAEKSRAVTFLPPARLAADELITNLELQIVDMRAELAELNVERHRLIAEAQLYDLDDGALGRTEPADSDTFEE